jgi:hypothetical protein
MIIPTQKLRFICENGSEFHFSFVPTSSCSSFRFFIFLSFQFIPANRQVEPDVPKYRSFKNNPNEMKAIFIFYYILAAFGILGSAHVLFTIIHRFKYVCACSTHLILMLHFSLLAEEILGLPYLFHWDRTLCSVTAALFEYFGILNILVVGCMVYAHRYSILDPTIKLPKWFLKRGCVLLFLLPCIVFVFFIYNIYVRSDSPWCNIPYSVGVEWYGFLYSVWIWIVLAGSILSSVDLTVRLSFTSKRLLKSYCTTIGLYTLVSLLCWIPRTVTRFVTENDTETIRFISLIPIYVSGILYTIIFKKNRTMLEEYESSRMDSMIIEQTDLMFLFDMKDRQSLTSNDDEEHLLYDDDNTKFIREKISTMSPEYH